MRATHILSLERKVFTVINRSGSVSVCVLAVLMDGSDLDDCDLCVTCYVRAFLSVVVDGTGRVR